MFPIDLMVVITIAYAAGGAFYFARGLTPGARSTTFVLLHGLAVVLTRRFKPSGWLIVPATVFTLAFNTASTLLLLIPINNRVPLYVNDVPRWMHLW